MPLFGYRHGLVFLGVVMVGLGIRVQATLHDTWDINSIDPSYNALISYASWQLVCLGPVNIITVCQEHLQKTYHGWHIANTSHLELHLQ